MYVCVNSMFHVLPSLSGGTMHEQAEEHEARRCSAGADRAVSQKNSKAGRKSSVWCDVLFLPVVKEHTGQHRAKALLFMIHIISER